MRKVQQHNIPKKDDCNCKATKDAKRIKAFLNPEMRGREDDESILHFVFSSVINFIGVALLWIMAVFAIPIVLLNVYHNYKRTGRPYASVPRVFKKHEKQLVNLLKEDKKEETKEEDGHEPQH